MTAQRCVPTVDAQFVGGPSSARVGLPLRKFLPISESWRSPPSTLNHFRTIKFGCQHFVVDVAVWSTPDVAPVCPSDRNFFLVNQSLAPLCHLYQGTCLYTPSVHSSLSSFLFFCSCMLNVTSYSPSCLLLSLWECTRGDRITGTVQ